MRYYLLQYDKVAGYEERQRGLQAEHLAYVQAAAESGELLLGGSLADPIDGSAMLLFRADSAKRVEDFAAQDPYVTGGIVSHWHVRYWDVCLGAAVITE